MAQRFLRFFGLSKTQNEVYEVLNDFLTEIEKFETRNGAIIKFKQTALNNISKKAKNESKEDSGFNKEKEKSKEDQETQNEKNKGNAWYRKKWGSAHKGLSTYNFLKQFCKALDEYLGLAKSKNSSDLTREIKDLKSKLSRSAAINTSRSLKLIDEIAEKISEKSISKTISFFLEVFGFEYKKTEIKLNGDDKINEKFFTEKFEYPKNKCSGIKITTRESSKSILEIENNNFDINKTCDSLFENGKAYQIYYSVRCSIIIEKEDKEIKKTETSFYTNETFEEIYKKLQEKFQFPEGSKLLINKKVPYQFSPLKSCLNKNEQTKIFIKITDIIIFYVIIYSLTSEKIKIELDGSTEISEEFFTRRLGYLKDKYSGIKIAEIGSQNIFEIKNNDFNINKTYKEIFKNSKTYDIYYSVNFSFEIEGENGEKQESCYTNETFEEIYEKLQKKFGFPEGSKLLIDNEEPRIMFVTFYSRLGKNKQQKIFIKTIDIITFNVIYGLENKKTVIELDGNAKISEKSFTEKLEYLKDKYSGIKIYKEKQQILEVENNNFSINKTYKEIFKNNETYHIYYSIKCSVEIKKKGKKNKKIEASFYTNETCEEIYKKLKEKFKFSEKSKLLINDKEPDLFGEFKDCLTRNKRPKIFVDTTVFNNILVFYIYVSFKIVAIEVDGNAKISEEFFTKKLEYSKDEYSGIKIVTEKSSKTILEIENNDFSIVNKTYNKIFEIDKSYFIYYLVNCSVKIEGQNVEKQASFYKNENLGEICKKLQRNFNLPKESRLLINGHSDSSKIFGVCINKGEKPKIFIKTTVVERTKRQAPY